MVFEGAHDETDETAPYPTKFANDYVRTKISAEKLVLAANQSNQTLFTCAIRPPNVYGPNDPHTISRVIRTFQTQHVPFLLGSAKAKSDFVFVGNVAYAHVLAAQRLYPGSPVCGKAYFITENNRLNYFECFEPFLAAKQLHLPKSRLPNWLTLLLAFLMEWLFTIKIISLIWKDFDPTLNMFSACFMTKNHTFSCANAARDLDYQPLYTPAEGINRTLEWVRATNF